MILLVLTLIALNINLTSVACAVGPSVNPVQNRETLHVNIGLQCMYGSFEQQKYERKSCLN
jgi:H+/gluconate symporter-like permease